MTDEELEARIAAEEWWHTPEGLAEIARQEAEIEASIKGTSEIEMKIEAWLKEHPNA